MSKNYLSCVVITLIGSFCILNFSLNAQNTLPTPHTMLSEQSGAIQEGIKSKAQLYEKNANHSSSMATSGFDNRVFNEAYFLQSESVRSSDYEYLEHLDTGMNVPFASVVDDSGNTYITGSTSDADSPQGNFIVLKLDANGDVEWTFEQPSEVYTTTFGTAITLDASNNPVITGVDWNGNDMDAYTLKLDKDTGLQIWSHTFDNGQNSLEAPTTIAVKPSGETVVAGITYADNAVVYMLLQYDMFGNLEWSHIDSDVIPQSWNEPLSLAIHNDGTIAVTGFGAVSGGSSGYYEGYITALYDNNGQQLWRNDFLFERLADESDPNSTFIPTHSIGRSVAFDISGNVYVTGTFDYSSFARIGTIKYSPSGAEEWTRTYRGGANNDHITNGHEVKITSEEIIYVGGRHRMAWVDEGTVLLSYDTDGNENWAAETIDIIQIQDCKLILDNNELPIIAGIGYDVGNFNTLFKVLQYDATGVIEQSVSYLKEESNFEGFRAFIDLHTGLNDQVILTLDYHYTEKGGVFETVSLPLNSTGNTPDWVSLYESPLTQSNTRFINSTNDSQNNIYVAGDYGIIEDLTYYGTYFVAKYNENGEVEWQIPYNGLNGNETNSIYLRVDHNDDLIVFLVPGTFDETPLRIKKYTADGTLLWEAEEQIYEPYLTTFFIDSNNNIIAAGSGIESASSFDKTFVAIKYSPNGDALWKRFDTTGDPNDFIFEIQNGTSDTDGNIYFTGTSGTATMFSEDVDATVFKYDASGNLLWLTKYPQNDFAASGTTILQNEEGDFYIVGVRQEIVQMVEEMFTLKIDPEGDLLWEMAYGQSDLGRRVKPYTAFLNSTENLIVSNYSLYWVSGEATNNRITSLEISSNDGHINWTNNTEINRFYGDSYLDAEDTFYIWNQMGSSGLPETIVGGFADAELTIIDATGSGETISFAAPGMSLYTAASMNPLHNGKLILGGHVFNDYAMFSGLYFFEHSHTPLSIEDFENISGVTAGHQLGQNYPNPVSSTTEIPFYLMHNEHITITLYDYQGRVVAELANQIYAAGHHTLSFNKGTLNTGIYFYSIQAGTYSKARKMLVR